MDIEQITEKNAEELTKEEADYLKQNAELLTDEESEKYKDILSREEEEEDGGAVDIPDDSPNDDVSKTEGDGGDGEGQKGISFKSQEELDAYIAQRTAQAKTPTKDKDSEDEGDEFEIPDFFDKSYRPQDANELARKIAEKLLPLAAQSFAKMTAKEKKQVEETNKALDEQYDSLVSEGKVPKRGTDEAKKVDQTLTTLMLQYKLPDFKSAYDLYSKIPEEHGGGYKTQQRTPVDANKKRAAIVAGSRGGTVQTQSPKMTYKDLSTKSMDELLEDA